MIPAKMDTNTRNGFLFLAIGIAFSLVLGIANTASIINLDKRLVAVEESVARLDADISGIRRVSLLTLQLEIENLRAEIEKLSPSGDDYAKLRIWVSNHETRITQLQIQVGNLQRATREAANFLMFTFPERVQFWACVNGYIQYGCR